MKIKFQQDKKRGLWRWSMRTAAGRAALYGAGAYRSREAAQSAANAAVDELRQSDARVAAAVAAERDHIRAVREQLAAAMRARRHDQIFFSALAGGMGFVAGLIIGGNS